MSLKECVEKLKSSKEYCCACGRQGVTLITSIYEGRPYIKWCFDAYACNASFYTRGFIGPPGKKRYE